ncbi:MAG: hypothetical protein HeimC3_17210 [Candidatus Heimdallarchaeota archaeon LC_3]|nr:MAG: hypothetical protein HeimC3_17210 [Candidatus Heimdallarchaeota archaeon LC_3]
MKNQLSAIKQNYSKEELFGYLFNRKDIKNWGIFNYSYLLFIFLIYSISIVPRETIPSVNFYLIVIYFLIALFIPIMKTFTETQSNNYLRRDLYVSRLIISLFIAIIVSIFIIWMNFYFNSINIYGLSLGLNLLFIFISTILMIPLIIYTINYNTKRENIKANETLLELEKSSLARKLTKYYLLTRLSEIKNILDTTNPLTFDMKFKKAIEKNINELVNSFKSNGLTIKNTLGVKKIALEVASPLREHLREAIGKNFTELYLNGDYPTVSQIDFGEVWQKINKAYLQWESKTNSSD